MVRIDITDSRQKWRYSCPAPERHRNWRVVDGLFECRACGETYRKLVDTESGEEITREEMEFVGPHADVKGKFGKPQVEE